MEYRQQRPRSRHVAQVGNKGGVNETGHPSSR